MPPELSPGLVAEHARRFDAAWRYARLSKFIVGWGSHLYYWIYPGVMVGVMGLLCGYLAGTLWPNFMSASNPGPVFMMLVAVVFGLWWAPFPVCAALGAFAPRARIAIPAGAAIGLVAWLGPLAAVNIRFGAGPTATSLAAIMGFGHEAVIPVVLTLLVGTLLGLTGAWLTLAWAFEITLGLVGIGIAGSAFADGVKTHGWRGAPGVAWHAFRHGDSTASP